MYYTNKGSQQGQAGQYAAQFQEVCMIYVQSIQNGGGQWEGGNRLKIVEQCGKSAIQYQHIRA